MTARLLPLVVLLILGGCTKPAPDETTTKSSASAIPPIDPPPPPVYDGTPLKAFADAAAIEGRPPLERAQFFYDDGQYWLGRLLIEPTAFSPDSPTAEAELLAKICQAQQDAACIAACSQKLGRKITMQDAGAREAGAPPEHKEPASDLARARDLVLLNKNDEARAILEPKVLSGSTAPEETRMLRQICKAQNDRMCVALCDTKLKVR